MPLPHGRLISPSKIRTLALAVVALVLGSLIACKEAERCDLELEQAPTIRGIRLGMTVAEVNALFHSPVISNPKTPDEPFRLTEEEIAGVRAAQLEGIEKINLQLLDGRIYYIRVEYKSNTTPRDKRAFLLRVSESLGLPDAWGEHNTIICNDFSLNAIYRREHGGPYIELTDIPKKLELYERKIRQQAVGEEKRNTFKP